MVANNKEDFLFQLHNELHRIGIDADEDIFADFEDHFSAGAREGLSEEETCRRLGDVKEIARSYLNLESSRINSIVAQAIEHEPPRVSLTKPGESVPADLSLKKEKKQPEGQSLPEGLSQPEGQSLPEYTPEHFSDEIYPNAANSKRTSTASQPTASQAATNQAAASGASSSAQNTGSVPPDAGGGQSASGSSGTSPNGGQTVAQALGAAGHAAIDAIGAAGHAVAEAFGTDAVKSAGKSAAEAMKNAGRSVAEAVKTGAENIKAEHAAEHERRSAEQAKKNGIPEPCEDMRENYSNDHVGTIPDQKSTAEKGGFRFSDVKGMQMNPSFSKLFIAILLDVVLWWWLVLALGGIAIGLINGAFVGLIGGGFTALFASSEFYFISRLFLAIGMISLGVIVFLLAILLIKGIIGIVKHVVIQHVKALYDL